MGPHTDREKGQETIIKGSEGTIQGFHSSEQFTSLWISEDTIQESKDSSNSTRLKEDVLDLNPKLVRKIRNQFRWDRLVSLRRCYSSGMESEWKGNDSSLDEWNDGRSCVGWRKAQKDWQSWSHPSFSLELLFFLLRFNCVTCPSLLSSDAKIFKNKNVKRKTKINKKRHKKNNNHKKKMSKKKTKN